MNGQLFTAKDSCELFDLRRQRIYELGTIFTILKYYYYHNDTFQVTLVL